MSGFKILACGDIHVELEKLRSVFSLVKKEKVDLLVLSGDFCDGKKLSENATVNDFLEQVTPVVKILHNTEIPIFFVLGNHDPIELTPILEKNSLITDLHGKTLLWNNYNFGGIGGSHMVTPQLFGLTLPFLEGLFPDRIEWEGLEFVNKIKLSNETHYFYSNVLKLYEKVFPCDVLITHTPPLLPQNIDFNSSSAGLYKLISIYRPILCLSGHIHIPIKHIIKIPWKKDVINDGCETILINLGSLYFGKVVLIELDEYERQINQIHFFP